jgi:REP element-mobilizing transposase RayT
MYHFVFPAKYRREVFTERVDKALKWACLEMEPRYEIYFLEIGTDKNHAHFLVQSIPTRSPTDIAMKIKSITLINSPRPVVPKKLISDVIAKTEAANICMMQRVLYIFHLTGITSNSA